MQNENTLRQAARIALFTSFGLLVIKFTAFFMTDSKAILSDAIESIINVVTAGFLVISIAISSRPADQSHPYGHGKIEAFSAGLEGGLIILAAIMIGLEAVPAFFTQQPPRNLGPGIFLIISAGLVNLLVGLYLLHSGKKLKSEALRADGHHLLTDFYTSAGIVIGLFLVHLTGIIWLDPFMACLVAVHLLIPGISLVRSATRNLMNEADQELLARIVSGLNAIRKPGWLYPHKLRALRSGQYHHVDLHISLPHYWTLDQVHEVEQEITDLLLEAIGEEGDVMLHVDPCEPDYCPSCETAPCEARDTISPPPASVEPWTVEQVTAARPGDNADSCTTTSRTRRR